MKFIAHHGIGTKSKGGIGYGDNSVLSVKRAIECGFYDIEIDLRLSKDREPVCIHDPIRSGVEVRHSSWSSLKRMGVTHFDDILAALGKDVNLWVDVKTTSEDVLPPIQNAKQKVEHFIRCMSFSNVMLEKIYVNLGIPVYKLAHSFIREQKISLNYYTGVIVNTDDYEGEYFSDNNLELLVWGVYSLDALVHYIGLCTRRLISNRAENDADGITGAIVDFVPWEK